MNEKDYQNEKRKIIEAIEDTEDQISDLESQIRDLENELEELEADWQATQPEATNDE